MNDIEEFCEKYLKDVNYTINPDNTIDVNGDVILLGQLGNMEKLPVKFGKVSGDFWCHKNNLTTLEGCPNYVGGNFLCYENKLTTLEHCPKYIGGKWFDCDDNELTTLKGIEKCEIIGDFRCYDNPKIPPENHIYILTAKIGGSIYINDGKIDNILNTYKNEVKYLHKALSELKKVVL
jgi:hypothetical protein